MLLEPFVACDIKAPTIGVAVNIVEVNLPASGRWWNSSQEVIFANQRPYYLALVDRKNRNALVKSVAV